MPVWFPPADLDFALHPYRTSLYRSRRWPPAHPPLPPGSECELSFAACAIAATLTASPAVLPRNRRCQPVSPLQTSIEITTSKADSGDVRSWHDAKPAERGSHDVGDVIRGQVSVMPFRHPCAFVTELRCDHRHRCAGERQAADAGVPEDVEGNRRLDTRRHTGVPQRAELCDFPQAPPSARTKIRLAPGRPSTDCSKKARPHR